MGHAVWCARDLIGKNENFAVILPDDIILSKKPAIKQLIEVSKKTNGGSVLALEEVPRSEVYKYGVVKTNKKINNYYSIEKLVEKPEPKNAPSNLSVVGRYILNSRVFDFLDRQKKGFGNEIQLTDSLGNLKKNGLYGLKFEGDRFDCGSKLGFIEANLNFGLNDEGIKRNLRKILRKL